MSVSQSEQIDQLAAAYVKAQAEVEGAAKTSENPFFRSKYADLSSVWLACRDALHRHGLSVVQFPGYEAGAALLTTILLHSSGQWMAGTAGAPLVDKKTKDGTSPPDAQSVGAAITYLRRFALAAVVGVVQEDDDGESAAGRGKQAVRGRPESPSGGPKEPKKSSPTAAPQSLDERPKQLAEEKAPWDELSVHRDLPCPLDPKHRPISGLRRNQLKFVEAYLDAHPDYPKADEWRIVVQKELASA